MNYSKRKYIHTKKRIKKKSQRGGDSVNDNNKTMLIKNNIIKLTSDELAKNPIKFKEYFKTLFNYLRVPNQNFNEFYNNFKLGKMNQYSTLATAGSGASIIKFESKNQIYIGKVYKLLEKNVTGVLNSIEINRFDDKTCYKLPSLLNEILLNIIITYHKEFKNSENETTSDRIIDKIGDNINKLEDIYYDGENLFIITKYLGVHEGIDKDIKTYTNLKDILLRNNSILKSYIIENIKDVNELLFQYDKFLKKYIYNPIIILLKYYYNKFEFIHTDFKLDNIFIKAYKYNFDKLVTKEFKILREKGLFIDFKPILADFDKSRIKINNIDYTPKRELINKLLKRIDKIAGIANDVRYNCNIKLGDTRCIDLSTEKYDILCMFSNILFLLHQIFPNGTNSTEKIIMHFPSLIEYLARKETLSFDYSTIKYMINLSKNFQGNRFADINQLIIKICDHQSKLELSPQSKVDNYFINPLYE